MFKKIQIYELCFSSSKIKLNNLKENLKEFDFIFSLDDKTFILGLSLNLHSLNKCLSKFYSSYFITLIKEDDKHRYHNEIWDLIRKKLHLSKSK